MILQKQEAPLFIRHLSMSILNGLSIGALFMAYIVIKKTLNASAFSVTLLTIIPTVCLLATLPLFHALGFGRRRKLFLMILATAGCIPLILLNVYSPVWLLIMAVGFVQFTNIVFAPSLNVLFKRHYRKDYVGKLFGIVSSGAVLASMTGAYLTGYLLDIDSNLFRTIFPIAGLLAFFAMIVLAYTPLEHSPDLEFHPFSLRLLIAPFKSMKRILTEDKEFFIFERNFFIYGVGFLFAMPVLPSYLIDQLHLDYKTISEARSVIGQIGVLLLSPFVGHLFDMHNPYRFTGYSYAILVFYPVFVALSSLLPYSYVNVILCTGFGISSVSMCGIGMSSHLSTIYFAEGKDSGVYQGIHATLTGLSGLIGSVFGFIAIEFFPYNVTFFISALFFALSAYLMISRHMYLKSIGKD
jgi:MFS family permease